MRTCIASTTRCPCRPLPALLRATTGRYVITFQYLLPMAALASVLSRAHVCWGGQLLRTALGVDHFSAELDLANSVVYADHPSASPDLHLNSLWLHDAGRTS